MPQNTIADEFADFMERCWKNVDTDTLKNFRTCFYAGAASAVTLAYDRKLDQVASELRDWRKKNL